MKFQSFLFLSALLVAMPGWAVMNSDVAAAVAIYKESHGDHCQQKKLKVQLLAAHQAHDQDKLNKLEPELLAINARLKPSEDKLTVLKAKFNKNPDDKTAYETALMELGDCGE